MKRRDLVFYLDEKDHKWLQSELNSSNGVQLLAYWPIKNQDFLSLAKLIITSSSSFHEFMDKRNLWNRLFFYEDKQIVSMAESKNLGIVYE
jgi:hypothetical protein